jgi:cytochrome c oxidase accessory protein FixG
VTDVTHVYRDPDTKTPGVSPPEKEAPALASLVKQAQATAGPVAADDQPLYVARRKVYPQGVSGTYRRIKWIVLALTLGVYYLLPFVRWDRGPGAPSQAVLVDFPNRRFYFFFIEIWPQEVYYLTGLLIIAALALFLMNAVAGRVWCGYLCPQTVWTDLFQAVERFIEGDRREHMLLDKGRWTLNRIGRMAAKHFLWLMIAWWTGGAWVLYFADAPTLVKDLATFQAPFIAYLWIGILTATTYVFAGHMREQVCTYMCPWPRIQAALTDEYALNVTYRYDRGEPRASIKKAEQLRAEGKPAGDCIDCMQCVYVCPTGVDIRGGSNLGCIQCGLCIDACDNVMAKIGRPPRLIAYDTELNIKRRLAGERPFVRILRWRTMFYAAVIVLAGGIMLYSLATRQTTGINLLHDRNPIFVRLSDGGIRNAYTLRILNMRRETRQFTLDVADLPGSFVTVVGAKEDTRGRPLLEVNPDQTREFRVLLTEYGGVKSASTAVTFVLRDLKSGETASASDYFRSPDVHP